MPRKCCVPQCRGNYDETEKISVFKFPSDPEKRNTWIRKIPRANFQPTSQSVVCAKHFADQYLIKSDSATRPDGTILTVERTRPKLSEDAYPSIFSNCPSYLSVEPPAKRKKPDERRAEVQKRDENAFSDWMKADNISSFSDFSNGMKDHVGDKWLYRLHSGASNNDLTTEMSYWSFYKINDIPSTKLTKPTLVSTIRVFTDMHVEVFIESIGK